MFVFLWQEKRKAVVTTPQQNFKFKVFLLGINPVTSCWLLFSSWKHIKTFHGKKQYKIKQNKERTTVKEEVFPLKNLSTSESSVQVIKWWKQQEPGGSSVFLRDRCRHS